MGITPEQKINNGLQQALIAQRLQRNAARRSSEVWECLAIAPVAMTATIRKELGELLLKYPDDKLGNNVTLSGKMMSAIALELHPGVPSQILLENLAYLDKGVAAYFTANPVDFSIASRGEVCAFKTLLKDSINKKPIAIVFHRWESKINSLYAYPPLKIGITQQVIDRIETIFLSYGELVCKEVVKYLSERKLTPTKLEKVFPYDPVKASKFDQDTE